MNFPFLIYLLHISHYKLLTKVERKHHDIIDSNVFLGCLQLVKPSCICCVMVFKAPFFV